jgi:hypothetical protein
MEKQGKIIDAPGLVFTYTPHARKKEVESVKIDLAEASVRILGALLLLYRQYVPVSSYYEVHQTSAF